MTANPRIQQLHQSGATGGQVPTWDSGLGLWVPETPAGGGGSGGGGGAAGIDDPATFDAEWGSTALVPDLEFNGSTSSLPSSWSWVNQGDSTYEEFADYGQVYAASTGGSTGGNDTHRMLVRPIPTDSSFRAFFSVPDIGGEALAWTRWAIVLRESSTGRYLLFGPATDNPDSWAVHLSEWNDTNDFSSNVMIKGQLPSGVRYVQVRKVSASSWRFYTSANGRVWTRWWAGYDPDDFSAGSVTFDEIGMLFAVNDGSFTGGTDVELGWFRIR